jgi:hypothetical protein
MVRIRQSAISLFGAIPVGGISYVAQRALATWGGLDPLADFVGRWLKMNVTGEQVAWGAALLLCLALYAAMLWTIWHRRNPKSHHQMGSHPSSSSGDSYVNEGENYGSMGPTYHLKEK